MPDSHEEILHFCLEAKGKHPSCNTCELRDKFCAQFIKTMKEFHGKMLKDLPWLSFQDRKDILQDGLVAVTEHISTLRNETAFNSWAWRIFSNKCANVLRQHGRADRLSNHISSPPDNIDALCNDYSKYVEWKPEESKLLVHKPLPDKICKSLKKDATFADEPDRGKWSTLIDRLYRYSHQPIFTDSISSGSEPEQENHVNENEQNVPEHDELLCVFDLIGTRQAEECKELFMQLVDNDHDRERVSDLRNQTKDALRKQISRCYQLFRKKILAILREISTEDGTFCFSLFSELFAGKSGLQTAIQERAERSGRGEAWVARQIHRCRVLALMTIRRKLCFSQEIS
jgi:RNA polymerase sigma factor (sigma-70 family)